MAARQGNRICAGEFAEIGPCDGPAVLRCGSCGAVNYCSRSHQLAHWKEHKKECSRMTEQMARSCEMHDFPFSFTAECTQLVHASVRPSLICLHSHVFRLWNSDDATRCITITFSGLEIRDCFKVDEGAVTICSFLAKRELHLEGLWQGVCQCADPVYSSCYSAEWHLPSQMCPCTDPSERASDLLKDWTEYYSWRQLPLNSPVALLLHWPLTLYHALGLVSRHIQNVQNEVGAEIYVHYLGPEKELHILHVFAELMSLLPFNTHMHIDMIGPAIPASRDGEVLELSEYPKCLDAQCLCKKGRVEKLHSRHQEAKSTVRFSGHVTLKLWRGLYHNRYLDLSSTPDLVLAPNAGIGAFSSWRPTIELLSRLKTPAIFTDYCEDAADLAADAVSVAHPGCLTCIVQANPFRQPFSAQDKFLNLPTYSNCFIFGIN